MGSILNFSTYVATHAGDHFTGRDWVFQEIDAWLADPDAPRVFMLSGEPGSGKTTVAARLVQFSQGTFTPPKGTQCLRPGFLSAVHFCFARERRWVNPHTFAESMALQLAERYQPFAKALAEQSGDEKIRIESRPYVGTMEGGQVIGVQIDYLEVAAVSAEDAFGRVVREPLEILAQEEPSTTVILLVDALDEALDYTGPMGIVPLLSQTADLPGNVRLLVTGRQDAKLMPEFRGARRLVLSAAKRDDQNRQDITGYVTRRLGEHSRLKAGLAALKPERAAALPGEIAAKAKGNFRYVAFLLDGIARGQRSLDDLDELPPGLDALYHDSLERLVRLGKKDWTRDYAPLMGVLSVAQESLALTELESLTGQGEGPTGSNLSDLLQFVETVRSEQPGASGAVQYRLYHQSVADFFQRRELDFDDEAIPNDYYLPAKTWHGRIADYYWQSCESRWEGCGVYGLQNLALHLHQAGQFERLKELINPEWMAARFEGYDYRYDGFIADVMLGWQHAHDEALRQIESGQAPAALADCVRYALIRTSINSLSANYVSELIARAVETGLWSVGRALSVAYRLPDPRQMVELVSALLSTGRLDPGQIGQAAKRGLDTVLAIEEEWQRSYALAALAPYLSGDLLRDGLAAAQNIQKEQYRAGTLAALAPQLSGDLLRDGLAVARALENEAYRAQALAALAPQLSGDLLRDGLAEAREIEDENYRADALAALAPQLSGDLLRDGLAAARAFENEESRARVLAALAPQLSSDERKKALRDGLATTRGIEDDWGRAEALAALAPHLSGDEREKALRDGLAAARAIQDEFFRADALAALVPYLSGDEREGALRDGLAAARGIEDDNYRADTLTALAPYLNGDLLSDGLAAARAFADEHYRARVLADLAPQLSKKVRDAALRDELAAALAIRDELDQTDALAVLVLHLSGKERVAALRAGLAAILAVENEGPRSTALTALAPQLSGDLARDGLAAALAIEDENYRARVLAALAPQLNDDEREEALRGGPVTTRGIWSENYQVNALTSLAPYLSRDEREDALRDVLTTLALFLSEGELEEILRGGLAAARDIEDNSDRAEALTALALYLSGDEREEALRDGLAAALAIQDEFFRADALATLAPQLSGALLRNGLSATLTIHSEEDRARALAALASQLPDELLNEGFAAAETIADRQSQADALTGLCRPGQNNILLLRRIRSCMAGHLWEDLPHQSRSEVLSFCADARLFTPPIVDQDILAAVARQIVEVCTEWQWM